MRESAVVLFAHSNDKSRYLYILYCPALVFVKPLLKLPIDNDCITNSYKAGFGRPPVLPYPANPTPSLSLDKSRRRPGSTLLRRLPTSCPTKYFAAFAPITVSGCRLITGFGLL